MNELKDFRKSAIMLLYPDGTIKNCLVDTRLVHLKYFIDLYNSDEYFKKLVDENKIPVPDDFWNSDMVVTYEIDKELTRIGVIVFHNLFVYETLTDDGYIENTPPLFLITMPNKFTDKQEEIMKELLDCYDMSNSFYSVYTDNELIDISYDEFLNITNVKRK